jgi:hypothetical protein
VRVKAARHYDYYYGTYRGSSSFLPPIYTLSYPFASEQEQRVITVLGSEERVFKAHVYQ